MDITNLRVLVTIASFITFIGIWIWAWSKNHKTNFNDAANLPFEGEKSE